MKKSLVFAAVVVDAVFKARMQFGSRGVSQVYPAAGQLQQVLETLLRLTEGQADGQPDIGYVCQVLIEVGDSDSTTH